MTDKGFDEAELHPGTSIGNAHDSPEREVSLPTRYFSPGFFAGFEAILKSKRNGLLCWRQVFLVLCGYTTHYDFSGFPICSDFPECVNYDVVERSLEGFSEVDHFLRGYFH